MSRKTIDRTGEENYNKWGSLMRIIEYKNANDILIEFQDEYKIRKSALYKEFKKGNVKNPYDKSVFGVGYIGDGKYKSTENGRVTKAYNIWHNMLMRCYEPYCINKHISYKDCTVCEDWLCFQNFCKWYEENYYEIPNEKMHLDKDILVKGNKTYSPETCIFLPQKINNLFIKSDTKRGKYPIGIYWHKANNKFEAKCSTINKEDNKIIYLGLYDTSEEAFLAYKTFKENYIKQVADEYKDIIPQKLYDALYKYEVEIND